MVSPFRGLAVTACRPVSLCTKALSASYKPATTINSFCIHREISVAYRLAPSIASHHRGLPATSATQYRAFHASQASRTNARFSYGISAAFTAKDRRYNPDSNVFNFNPYNRIRARRKDKRTRPDSGQDAFFVSRIGDTSDVAFGVADGVGGWIDSGVDPADFSHGFCDYMAHAAYTYKADGDNAALRARSLMQRGYEEICKDESVPAGGSTACVGIARADGTLEVANLGDSGFIQLRLNAIHNYSEPQTHAFNTPYQLSVVPEKVMAQSAAFGGPQLRDFPKDANVSQHMLRHGDVLVFASDGVWDNLSRQDILRIVSRIMTGARAWDLTDGSIKVSRSLQHFIMGDDCKSGTEEIPPLQSFLAAGIASEAKAASVNTKVDGPFAKEVQRYYPYENWRGGKVDDICVVVVIVGEEGK